MPGVYILASSPAGPVAHGPACASRPFVGTVQDLVDDRRLLDQRDGPHLAAERAGRVAGFAYAMQRKERAAYRHTADAVYVHPSRGRQGSGWALYEVLKMSPAAAV